MADRKKTHFAAREMAFGGVMAALAAVIMCLGGLIPLATFVCPMLCMLMLKLVYGLSGHRVGWAWYAAVAVLSVLFSPDKEGAAFFVFFGAYPLLKPGLDKLPLPFLWKLLYFNALTLVMYSLLIWLFGMDALAAEFREMGKLLLAVTLLLANVCFFLLDMILSRRFRRK